MYQLLQEQMAMSEKERILEGQLRESYGRVVYSHKTQEKCADILFQRHQQIKLTQLAVSALVTGGVLSTFLISDTILSIVSAVLSTLLLAINAYTKDYDLGAIAQKHRQAGAELWIIREEYLSLLTDLRVGGLSLEAVRTRRDSLVTDLHGIYTGAPSTVNAAYRKAQNALKQLEDMTFSDAEIDAFLPRELKRMPKHSTTSPRMQD